ncbi:ATP-binding cassette domain-containing protein [Halomonas sp. YLGW01]|uniref:ATP-binding cassette domain-containing protein n=1 Tax=Halomonas sp. YLGW01 TaxID=2773308 RepID=UPI001785EC90|nr:ATP-binding cassette domain-containing protein [Halomonas sp. YLGW01]
MIDVRAASFEVDGTRLLHPTDLSLAPGQVVGLIGHNGSGKSTLLKLLARQQPPSQGAVHLDGTPLDEWDNRAFARRVAYLPQQLPPAEDLTCRELVGFGRYPWQGLLGRPGREDRAQIERALTLTGTQAFAGRRVDSLSGGERQRVWLAMLLAQGSQYLMLDEPLAALDIAHQVEVLELIRRLCHELGLGVIIVLHDINMAARYCDRLIALHGGRVQAKGSPEQLMHDATLEAIYGLPMRVMPHPGGVQRIAVVH